MTNFKTVTATVSAVALILGLATMPSLAAQTDITVGMQLEPPNLDPTGGAAAAIDEVVYANVFEGLTRFTADGEVVPALAESWDISEDGLTYTFHLRDGVTFHDGSSFDAEDVKFSIDRARAEDSTNAQKALFADIQSVEAVDAQTVKITLSQPNGLFLFNMAWGDAVIVAPETADTLATDPVGTGPFAFATWTKGDSVALEKYAEYWGEAPRLDKVTFKFIPDPTAAFAAVMAGDVDAYPNFPAPENLEQFKADPRFTVIVGSTEGETILAMNNKKAPLDDIKIRQAISHAIDRQAIIDGALFGYGTPIGTHFAPHNPDYVDLTGQSAHDPEMARKLLDEAGVSDLTLSLKLPPPAYARRGGEIIAAQLKEVGITAEITNVEWAQWLEDVFKAKNFDLTIVSHTEPMDIGIYARDDYYFQYADADFKAILEELNKTTDPANRSELLGKAQRKIADDAVNAYLFQLPRTGVANAKIMGLWPNAPTQANDMTAVYWVD
ncbi:ABC transporter substrate-binding protein [Pseudohoeflea coraliihabitans]|uniref:ABC transporter substrate-binding protein n=1 Tax=Pseudohoeflea coraliihabitans TaxID=2860393 RepID=A0ABS6WTV3_9HYPH|nr:ABC transporter substrate-binding protein [Pseudohoeflea sp. DP4N28-3]MBW3099063.1 ABC transporter substrate-binding protein [Pseudohoeflea sp. DP4N28-3]